jgi:hypothetical protein
MRHPAARNAARDDHDQSVPVQLAAPQVGGPAGRLSLPGAIAGPAMTIGAVGLLQKDSAPIREIVGPGTGDKRKDSRQSEQ